MTLGRVPSPSRSRKVETYPLSFFFSRRYRLGLLSGSFRLPKCRARSRQTSSHVRNPFLSSLPCRSGHHVHLPITDRGGRPTTRTPLSFPGGRPDTFLVPQDSSYSGSGPGSPHW